ncbi:nitrogenase cofactor biosynthesis protein NifB [Desulfospira joergensenii]|uniref:nitrogenase cofactor biosynthesis protein NifB n=1 Tax=Desulfospira joergensenii TaxID=53329 RepID=UPI0003B73370|nr:nitrogenase cofactor biosynthesis protein NifB [Desulfospira joergensenii]
MNLENHPCFNPGACKSFGRVHLPVAPRCNIQCNFCNRKFDCVNETRPGVTSTILKPFQAMNYLEEVFKQKRDIAVVGIAGPGDPFANPDQTLATLSLVREKYPEMILCLSTNGLNIFPYLDEIKRLKVSHVTITVNAVDPEIGEKVYSWVRTGKRSVGPRKGAEILLEKQLEAVQGLKERGIIVKINTIILPGINDHHAEAIAKKMAGLKADLHNCIAYYPSQGSNLADLEEPSKKMIQAIRKKTGAHLPQMLHCARCRADAVGKLGEKEDTDLMGNMIAQAMIKEDEPKKEAPEPVVEKPRLAAVATREGVLVNQHLGEATHLNIYDLGLDVPVMVDKRSLPEPGGRNIRWMQVAEIIKDCGVLLVSGIGQAPKTILTRGGVRVLEVNGLITEVLTHIKNKTSISHLKVRERTDCGATCQGSGMGCM